MKILGTYFKGNKYGGQSKNFGENYQKDKSRAHP
jgi:hypothetical protein